MKKRTKGKLRFKGDKTELILHEKNMYMFNYKINLKYSLKPVAEELSKLLNKDVKLAKEDLVVMVASGVENVIGSRKNYEF